MEGRRHCLCLESVDGHGTARTSLWNTCDTAAPYARRCLYTVLFVFAKRILSVTLAILVGSVVQLEEVLMPDGRRVLRIVQTGREEKRGGVKKGSLPPNVLIDGLVHGPRICESVVRHWTDSEGNMAHHFIRTHSLSFSVTSAAIDSAEVRTCVNHIPPTAACNGNMRHSPEWQFKRCAALCSSLPLELMLQSRGVWGYCTCGWST